MRDKIKCIRLKSSGGTLYIIDRTEIAFHYDLTPLMALKLVYL